MLCLLASTAVPAGAAKDSLLSFFSNVQTARAAFTQEVLDIERNVIQQSSGTMWLSRPGRFRWDYEKPYQQLIVADGERVWMYDVDLEQVTVRKVDNVIGNAPALLLSGNTPLEENFEIEEQPASDDGLLWVKLLPKQADTGFDSMLIAFRDETLQRMELRDSLGNLTRLVFTNMQRNPDIDEAQFVFTPPQGVDVIGEQPVTE
ncbi:MAG: outer membrane lipoprotein chaperone LolA [Granulosicoccaceae bacterium]|jgi:outer membrane lipoprotein carrier protein